MNIYTVLRQTVRRCSWLQMQHTSLPSSLSGATFRLTYCMCVSEWCMGHLHASSTLCLQGSNCEKQKHGLKYYNINNFNGHNM